MTWRTVPKSVWRRELFYFLSALWLALDLLELIFPRIVLAYFNLNYLLLASLAAGGWLLIKGKYV